MRCIRDAPIQLGVCAGFVRLVKLADVCHLPDMGMPLQFSDAPHDRGTWS